MKEKGIRTLKIILIWDQTNYQNWWIGGHSNNMCFTSAEEQGQDQQVEDTSDERMLWLKEKIVLKDK